MARPETLIHGREVRVNTGSPSPHLVQKVSICDTNHQVQGWATTGEASEYLKKTSVRDLFVMSYGTGQSSETMSLTVKITALWALKVPLEEVCRFSHHSQGSVHTSDVSLGTQITTDTTSQDGGYSRNFH